jgi:hypothetical protein
MYQRQKVTAYPAIGPFSNYIWEKKSNSREKKEMRQEKKNVPRKTSRLSEYPNIIPALVVFHVKMIDLIKLNM